MVRLGIVALVVAGFLGYMTYTEGSLAVASSAQPEEISLAKLLARGPDGNAHIILTDFALCDNLVNQANENSKNVWTDVWIPIVPSEEVDLNHKGPLTPRNVKALFFSTGIRNDVELEAKLNKPKVQAMVTNRITSLKSNIRALLQQSYPDTNFDKCLIIQEGRAPYGFGSVMLLAGGCVLALLVALAFFAAAFFRK